MLKQLVEQQRQYYQYQEQTNIAPQNKSFKSTCLKNILNKKIDNKEILKKIAIAYEKFIKEINNLSFLDLKRKYK